MPCSESHSRMWLHTYLLSSIGNLPPPPPLGLGGTVAIPKSMPTEIIVGSNAGGKGQKLFSEGLSRDMLLLRDPVHDAAALGIPGPLRGSEQLCSGLRKPLSHLLLPLEAPGALASQVGLTEITW